jgi:putative SOS response-associated peptidase YedK
MCGRFILYSAGRIVAEHFQLGQEPPLEPRYNIAPTQPVAVVRLDPDSNRRKLAMLRWGLIPFWAKDIKIGYKMINARSETAPDKPAFRSAFKKRRCLIPADGFYEWKSLEGRKEPYLVRLRDEQPFAFAGLWERWEGPDDDVIESCTILTTGANEFLSPIHDRMPVILAARDYHRWLDPLLKDPKTLHPLLVPYPPDEMKAVPVSSRVNKTTYDEPDCIVPVKESE